MDTPTSAHSPATFARPRPLSSSHLARPLPPAHFRPRPSTPTLSRSTCAPMKFCRSSSVGVSTPGGSLDRRVNCRRVSQPRWVGARRSTKGGKGRQATKGKPAAFVLSCAQVGCACSRGLQASAWERARDLRVGPFSRAANLLVRDPWTFLL
jgi:hypothetical protein